MSYFCLEPARIGRMELPNRVIFPAMTMGYCTPGGCVTSQFANFHLARARGNVGLVTLEGAAVSREGKGFAGQLCLYDDAVISGLRTLVQGIHKAGSKVAVQLFHAGRLAQKALTGLSAVAPSDVPYGDEPVESLTEDGIHALVQAFAAAAARAREAGVDAVELNAGHGYLLQQFHSPFTNLRNDHYGSSPENRVRFTLQAIQAVRCSIGDMPLILQLGVEEQIPHGLTLEDGMALARTFTDAGVDALQVTAGLREAGMWITPPLAMPQAVHADRAGAVRAAIEARVPIITVGRIKSLELADEIIHAGKADFVALGRAMLADSYLPRKTQSGFSRRVRPCIGCNGCIERLLNGSPVSCAVNPFVGREGEEELFLPSQRLLHVVVVGGGPGGIVAAGALRHKGHRVTLLEKRDRLGGSLYTAALATHKSELREYADYLTFQAVELGVDIHYQCEATVQKLRRLRPHVVIVAVGSQPFIPNVEGLGTVPFKLATDVLETDAAGIAPNVTILGGGLVGCELAEFLVAKGHQVTVVEEREGLVLDMEERSRTLFRERLGQMGVVSHVSAKAVSVTSDSVEMETPEGTRRLENYGTLVVAAGYKADSSLRRELVSSGFSVIEVGDCVTPGNLMDTVSQAFEVLRLL